VIYQLPIMRPPPLQKQKECGTTQSNPNNTTKNHRVFMPTKQKTDWHRLLGLIFTDFFTGSAWNVELEKDLSMNRQAAGGTEYVVYHERLPEGLCP
jgi:hypothetical protein